MKLHALYFTPTGIIRARNQLKAGWRLCRKYGASLRSFLPHSVNSMMAAYNYDQIICALGITPPSTIVDIGANVSQMSKLLMLSCPTNPEIISFEPNPNLSPLGKRYEVALSDSDGETELYLPQDEPGWGTIESDKQAVTSSTAHYTVRQSRMDSLVGAQDLDWESLSHPILVKIDTEGSELRVLRGFGDLLQDVSILIIEVENAEQRGQNYNFLSLSRYLSDFGFTMCKILYASFEGPVAPSYCDVMFWKPDKAAGPSSVPPASADPGIKK